MSNNEITYLNQCLQYQASQSNVTESSRAAEVTFVGKDTDKLSPETFSVKKSKTYLLVSL
jgi:hypothetical protein